MPTCTDAERCLSVSCSLMIKRRAYCRRCVLQRRKRYACLQWPYASERYDASQKLGGEVHASGGAHYPLAITPSFPTDAAPRE
jgi:hypothetical protein